MKKKIFFPLLKYLASLGLIILVCLSFLIWWAVGETLPMESALPLETTKELPTAPAKNVLKVASYNIGHGQGVKANPWDYRDKQTTLNHLELLSKVIIAMDADVYLLQEVDVDSARTHRVNQIQFLKERTGLPYHACALMWQQNYIPYPYWPPSEHIGYVRAANCVLSRYPLSNHYRVIFEKPQSFPWWYRLGYLDRGIERVDVTIGEKKVAVLNVHLEAWEKEARANQVKVISDYMKTITLPIVLGGDFNVVPPDAGKKKGFEDEPECDYTDEQTFPLLFSLNQSLKQPTLKHSLDEKDLCTYPSNAPDRRLDHLFLLGGSLSFVDFGIFKEAGEASDHLPILATIDLGQ